MDFFAELIKGSGLKRISYQIAGGHEAHSYWAFVFDLGEAQVSGVKLAFDRTRTASREVEKKTTISILSGLIDANGRLTIDKEMADRPQATTTAMRAIARIVARQHGGTVAGPLI